MQDDYSQPDFYRFNSDSIELVKFILNRSLKPLSILDLGAGSGIIGIELARVLKPQFLTCLELQKEFEEHLKKNCEDFLPSEVQADIVISSFGESTFSKKFDLIVCNPPYYLPGAGELPQDARRALARTFLKDSQEILLKAIARYLAENGRAFLVLKKDEKILNGLSLMASAHGLRAKVHASGAIVVIELFTLNVD